MKKDSNGCEDRLLLKPAEAARILAVSTGKLRNLTKSKGMPCVLVGGNTRKVVRYSLGAIQDWIRQEGVRDGK